MKDASIVLNQTQIKQKTERIAFEILENSFEEETIFIAGIAGNGFTLAERIAHHLTTITDQEVRLFAVQVQKDNPLDAPITLSIADEDLTNQMVVIIDDVINSGRTMIHAVRRLLENKINILKVATLVNRTHRRYPVQADFVGLNIATTLKDNIIVELESTEVAYLA
jgi:pyrimidine operon attenuation protein/uracil phosphoribosyltransferase